MKSIKDFTDLELDDQLYNAKMDLEEAETNGDRNHALAELEVAKKKKKEEDVIATPAIKKTTANMYISSNAFHVSAADWVYVKNLTKRGKK